VAAAPRATAAAAPSGPVTLRAIRREVLAETLRITLELDREVRFYDERLEGPPRVFVDLSNTRAAEDLKDATIPFPDGVVKQVRVGRQLNSRTRVVLDLNGAGSHSVYTMYNPFRIVIDLQRSGSTPAATAPPPTRPTSTDSARAPVVHASNVSRSSGALVPPAVPREGTAEARPAPAAPPQNSNGSFSLARQLGLGVARVVIDPGHGGHDPGARGNGISEAALVLDVAARLETLLKNQNVEVVLTRREDTYLTLEERTALANKSGADLFLSIHANTNKVQSVRGVETYFLNFASNPEAEAIAARENAGSAKSMRHLPDIVQAIAMNNKLDESRDFATIVQSTLYTQLRQTNRTLKNLGVKQAPFMVLVNARMPSVLAEISFMSNRAEATLLKTERYKQQIAEALAAGIMRYQRALKRAAPARAE
jgi:N-acetylmuramoyl-L-alanine amidase